MAGVGKLLKQAQKMQKQMEKVQGQLADKEIELSSGGGAICLTMSGNGDFKSIKLDPDFLKEDKEFVEEALLSAIQEGAEKAKEYSEEEMNKITGGMAMPGLM